MKKDYFTSLLLSRNRLKKDKARLILCGEGIIFDSLKKFSEENGLKKFVDFKGY